jgi:N-acetylmuramoyl-L-alanine amidase
MFTVFKIGFAFILTAFCFTSCASRPGTISERKGDEIVVAGKFIHTGTRVITWMDPHGYDAYRVERRFAPFEESDWKTSQQKVPDLTSPNRYGLRKSGLTPGEIERVRGGGWDLPMLQKVVDQFVIHFDDAAISKICFKVLHDSRCLSVHFMLDVDGTIYQTLDLKERAWHATTSNTRSVGIEIANPGAHSADEENAFSQFYKHGDNGETTLIFPEKFYPTDIYTTNFVGHPARPRPVTGVIQEKNLQQYDFTPQQYEALVKLTATLCKIFPKMKCDYPRGVDGALIPHKLSDEELKSYQGVLGHFHVQTDKVDPGPAFQWDYVIGNAKRLMRDNADDRGVRSQLAPLQSYRLQRWNSPARESK